MSEKIKELWRGLANKIFFVVLLDFILLAFSVYFGYAVRVGQFYPKSAYLGAWHYVALSFGFIGVIAFYLFGQYRTIWIHAGTEDYVKFAAVYILAFVIFLMSNLIFNFAIFSRVAFAIAFFAGLFFCGGLRFSWLMTKSFHGRQKKRQLKTLIIGASEPGAYLARDLLRNENELYPAGFIDDDPMKIGMRISGLLVFGDTSQLKSIVESENFQVVLIALPVYDGKKIRQLYNILAPLNVQVRILPTLRELADGQVSVSRLRKVKLEDLLGRIPVKINLEPSMNYIKGKRVLITGAGGSIGSEIAAQVLFNDPAELYVLGHGEQSIYLLMEDLNKLDLKIPVKPVIADVADEIAMKDIFEKFKPQIVFHAAAHKHVPLMENSVREAMRVNALGTRTIARMAGKFNAERMVMISTDKAVNPSSVMGATKRLAEKLLEQEQGKFPETRYMAVRFGNVLGSRGSVVPKFEEQISSGGPVTVTHPDMRRYFMLVSEAVSLVIQAGALGHGGELFVLDMGEPVNIKEMAELLIRLSGYEPYKDINIVFSGIREGEKLFEELFYDENSVHGTLNPKIFVSKIKNVPAENEINTDLDVSLEYALRNPNEALSILEKLVPEYLKDS